MKLSFGLSVFCHEILTNIFLAIVDAEWIHFSVFHTLIYLWLATAVSTSTATNKHQPSATTSHTHQCELSTIFCNFKNLLAAFYWQTLRLKNNSAHVTNKTLNPWAFIQLEDVARVRVLTLRAQSRRLFWAASGREAAYSAGRTAADSSVNHLQNSISKHCRLLTVWTFKYLHLCI